MEASHAFFPSVEPIRAFPKHFQNSTPVIRINAMGSHEKTKGCLTLCTWPNLVSNSFPLIFIARLGGIEFVRIFILYVLSWKLWFLSERILRFNKRHSERDQFCGVGTRVYKSWNVDCICEAIKLVGWTNKNNEEDNEQGEGATFLSGWFRRIEGETVGAPFCSWASPESRWRASWPRRRRTRRPAGSTAALRRSRRRGRWRPRWATRRPPVIGRCASAPTSAGHRSASRSSTAPANCWPSRRPTPRRTASRQSLAPDRGGSPDGHWRTLLRNNK